MSEPITILLAEDDDAHFALIRKALGRIAKKNEIIRFRDGVEVIDFLTGPGQDGIEPAKKYLLLLDIFMPKMDGVAVLEKVKSDKLLKGMPVIMLSSMSDTAKISHCYHLGCDSFITKPVEEDSFFEELEKVGLYISVAQISRIDNPDAFYEIGLKKMKGCDFKNAIAAFQGAAKLRPDHVMAHFHIGLSWALLKKYDNAIEAFCEAAMLNPNDAETHYNLANTYLLAGKMKKAMDQYDILKDINTDLAEKLIQRIGK